MNKICTFPSSPLSQYPVGTWRGYCETISITMLALWNCRFALPAFPSSPCFNTRSKHDVTTVKLYLLLRWYCETVGLPYQHSLVLPLCFNTRSNMTWILWMRKWKHSGPSVKLHTEFDLLQVIMKVADSHNIDLIPEHVKAHQDNDCAYEDLSWKAN